LPRERGRKKGRGAAKEARADMEESAKLLAVRGVDVLLSSAVGRLPPRRKKKSEHELAATKNTLRNHGKGTGGSAQSVAKGGPYLSQQREKREIRVSCQGGKGRQIKGKTFVVRGRRRPFNNHRKRKEQRPAQGKKSRHRRRLLTKKKRGITSAVRIDGHSKLRDEQAGRGQEKKGKTPERHSNRKRKHPASAQTHQQKKKKEEIPGNSSPGRRQKIIPAAGGTPFSMPAAKNRLKGVRLEDSSTESVLAAFAQAPSTSIF